MSAEANPLPHKNKGHLQLKIEKLSEFASETNGKRYSEPVQVLGLQWKILATTNDISKPDQVGIVAVKKYLGFELKCYPDPGWGCTAFATFRLLAQKQGKPDKMGKFACARPFAVNATLWGYWKFVSFQRLLDHENGWYDEVNDSIVLCLDFQTDSIEIRMGKKEASGSV